MDLRMQPGIYQDFQIQPEADGLDEPHEKLRYTSCNDLHDSILFYQYTHIPTWARKGNRCVICRTVKSHNREYVDRWINGVNENTGDVVTSGLERLLRVRFAGVETLVRRE